MLKKKAGGKSTWSVCGVWHRPKAWNTLLFNPPVLPTQWLCSKYVSHKIQKINIKQQKQGKPQETTTQSQKKPLESHTKTTKHSF